jgi:superfamily I DNA/RNA helicase
MPTEEQASEAIEGIGHRDHSVTSEYRIFGAPGCGKTTSITRQVEHAVAKYGGDAVLVTSYSRAAAAELAGRDLPIARERIGTLHSHCYHALGRPVIAESCVDVWNRDNRHQAITPARKQVKLDGEGAVAEDETELAKTGDNILRELSRVRGLMIPRDRWSLELSQFNEKWTEYKQALGLLDFTDLIERCYRDLTAAPSHPAVIFADEAQDLNRMQLTLIRKWGACANYFILAGDDDQTIFSFTGASPDAILDPDIPEDHKIILKQSHRVPRAVHRLANDLIHRVTRRQEKVYLPRPEDGTVQRLSRGTYKSPEYFILKSAMEHMEQGKKVMFLASCSYMLHPLVAILRKNGIPFHNPYRKMNGFWNPLRTGKKGSSANRILSLLSAHPEFGDGHRAWTKVDLALWCEWLDTKGTLKLGAKEMIQAWDGSRPVSMEQLQTIFEPGALESLMAAKDGGNRTLLAWWRTRVSADVRKRIQFPAEIAARRGPQALLDKPEVVVGTIHSVKGGQADVVYLFPDLSQAGDAQYNRGGPARDSVLRLFYVGLTRARETLYICQRETGMAVTI